MVERRKECNRLLLVLLPCALLDYVAVPVKTKQVEKVTGAQHHQEVLDQDYVRFFFTIP